MSDPAETLPWDSDHFGQSIARFTGSKITPAAMATLSSWMRTNRVACTYLLADISDISGIQSIEHAGGHLVDARVTLEQSLAHAGLAPHLPIRPAVESDVRALGAIAAVSHRDGRFHADSHFDEARSDELYRIWIERSCNDGFADEVWVNGPPGAPTGYITTKAAPDSAGSIELIAVSEAARGGGIGPALVQQALFRFVEAGIDTATVVAHGRNTRAIRMYEAAGFKTSQLELWFHLWQ